MLSLLSIQHQMEAAVQTVTLTYTHATLSIVSETISMPFIRSGNRPAAKPEPGVVYTPGSTPGSAREVEDLIAAFYTATAGSAPVAPIQPEASNTTVTGTFFRAAYQSVGSVIDILA